MLEDLRTSRYGNHASNLGALIVSELAAIYSKEAYVVNPPVVDELMEEARVTGLPEIKRTSVFHALNQKAVAIRVARDTGVDYNKSRFIVAHLGGGVSVGAHDMGRVTDVNNGLEEGPFTPQRTGSLPVIQLVDLCFSGKYTKAEINKLLVGKGGLYAHTGISDGIILAEKAEKDSSVKLLFDAMAYRIAREICACAATLYGKVDRIIITGGLANDTVLVGKIKDRVSFLGPVAVYPGEDEMTALAEGMIRVLEGHETALQY
jgi:butyrate kinase